MGPLCVAVVAPLIQSLLQEWAPSDLLAGILALVLIVEFLVIFNVIAPSPRVRGLVLVMWRA